MSAETDADGNYDFSGLRAGDYTVEISGFDAEKYVFDPASQSVSVAAGDSSNVSFAGALTRLPGQVDYLVRIENVSKAYDFMSSGRFAVPVGEGTLRVPCSQAGRLRVPVPRGTGA